MVRFTQVPSDSNVPFTYIELDPSRADAPESQFKTLLIGQKLAAGNVAANQPRTVSSVAEAQVAFGANSQLAHMTARFRQNTAIGELWAVAVDDPAGTAASADITVTSAPTARGIIALYIDGRRIQIPVVGNESANATADLIHNAVMARESELSVTSAEPAAAKVTLTHRHKGNVDLDVRWNYQPDDIFPQAFAGTIVITAGGGVPAAANLQAAIDSPGDEEFGLIVHPYADAASLATLEERLTTRWGPTAQTGGIAVTSVRTANHTPDEATAFGNARNNPFSCVLGHGAMPTPTYELAAAVAGAIHTPASDDPARPFQTLQIKGVLAPPVADRWNHAARNTVLGDGIATYKVGAGSVVRVERLVSTYQRSAANLPDKAYQDINTPMTLQHIRRDWRNYFGNRYARHKLADDGTEFAPGQPIMTPTLGRAEALGKAREWALNGYIEDLDAFAEGLIVQRNAQDRNRLDFLMTPNLVNQLRITAVSIGFIL